MGRKLTKEELESLLRKIVSMESAGEEKVTVFVPGAFNGLNTPGFFY